MTDAAQSVNFFCHLHRMVCMVGIVLVRQRTMAVHIAILDQIKIDGSGGICIHNLFVAVCVRKNLANKQVASTFLGRFATASASSLC